MPDDVFFKNPEHHESFHVEAMLKANNGNTRTMCDTSSSEQ